VVPGALYRHVRGKDQLHDLVVDGMLAEVAHWPWPRPSSKHFSQPACLTARPVEPAQRPAGRDL